MRELLAIRQREIIPRLAGAAFGKAHAAENGLLTANWRMGDGASLLLHANLSKAELAGEPCDTDGAKIWGDDAGKMMPPWSVVWRLGAR